MSAQSGRSAIWILAGIAAFALLGFVGSRFSAPPANAPKTAGTSSEPTALPTLDCAFHDFMRKHAVVSFYFDVSRKAGEQPRFFERALVLADGGATAFDGGERPEWSYALDSDGTPTLAAPDGETTIMLYGLKLGAPGDVLLESGIRSIAWRNLGGQCRQSNLDKAG